MQEGGFMTDTSKKNKPTSHHLNGIDGYYYTGEVNLQTTQGNENLTGEMDQYVFRGEYSMAQHYHGRPEYSIEEDWREWDKGHYESFQNSRTKEEQRELREKVINRLEEMAEFDRLNVAVFEGDVFVSGRVKTDLDKSYFTEQIKDIDGIKNVVNHLCCIDEEDESYQGPYRVLSQEFGLGEGGR